MKKYIICVLLGLVMLFNVSCDSDNDSDEVVLTESNSGSTVTLKVDEKLLVILDSQPSTGYIWYLTELNESIVSQNGESEFSPDNDLIGAPGKERWPFKAVAVGQTNLRMEYRRSGESANSVMFVTLIVK